MVSLLPMQLPLVIPLLAIPLLLTQCPQLQSATEDSGDVLLLHLRLLLQTVWCVPACRLVQRPQFWPNQSRRHHLVHLLATRDSGHPLPPHLRLLY